MLSLPHSLFGLTPSLLSKCHHPSSVVCLSSVIVVDCSIVHRRVHTNKKNYVVCLVRGTPICAQEQHQKKRASAPPLCAGLPHARKSNTKKTTSARAATPAPCTMKRANADPASTSSVFHVVSRSHSVSHTSPLPLSHTLSSISLRLHCHPTFRLSVCVIRDSG